MKLHLQAVLRQIKFRIFSNKRPRCNKHPPTRPKHQTSAPSPPPSLYLIHIAGIHGKPVSIATLLITLCVNCIMDPELITDYPQKNLISALYISFLFTPDGISSAPHPPHGIFLAHPCPYNGQFGLTG